MYEQVRQVISEEPKNKQNLNVYEILDFYSKNLHQHIRSIKTEASTKVKHPFLER